MSFVRLRMAAARINQQSNNYTLLDVGCRTKDLKPMLVGCEEYYGTDLIPADGVLQCNLDDDLPFGDDSFDVVTALDVLEHLDNPHAALSELIRVARKTVIVSLPNMYYIEFRLRFLAGGGLSGKYRFSSEPILDRHKWVLSYNEAQEFIYNNTSNYHCEHDMILPQRKGVKKVAEPIQRWLAQKWPNLFSYGIIAEITVD